jgi:hypothetical protein
MVQCGGETLSSERLRRSDTPAFRSENTARVPEGLKWQSVIGDPPNMERRQPAF